MLPCGVPHGSILGLILFFAHTNNTFVKLFADDTNLYIFSTSQTDLEVMAKDCLDRMHNCLKKNETIMHNLCKKNKPENVDKTTHCFHPKAMAEVQ